jgi:hypothetical protein
MRLYLMNKKLDCRASPGGDNVNSHRCETQGWLAITAFHSLLAVVDLCAAAAVEDQEVWRRRAYVWRNLGKVLPDGAPNTRGSGASKRYAAAAIPLIAVLLAVSQRFASVQVLDAISQAIQRNLTKNRAFSKCWAAALRREASYYRKPAHEEEMQEPETEEIETSALSISHTYITIAFPSPGRTDDEFAVRCGAAPRMINGEDIDIYVLDIGFIFDNLFNEGLVLFGEDSDSLAPRG